MSEREYLPHSAGCFLCGDENPCGIRARFFVQENTVRARVILPSHFQGYNTMAHGGVLAGLLDETMGWAASIFGHTRRFYLTGELNIKYVNPIPVQEEIQIVGHLLKDGGRIAYCQGEIEYQGKTCLKARGKFLPFSKKTTLEILSYLKFDRCREYVHLYEELKWQE